MHIANVLAMALGFVVAAIGILGLAAPSALVELGRSLQSATALYVVAAVRVGFGAILLWAAPNSRTPIIFRILGILIIIAGIVTPFFGSRTLFDWWSIQGSSSARAWSFVAIGLGLFIAYATAPRGSAS